MKIRHVFDFDTAPVSLRKRLRHEPRLESHLRVAHLAFDFGARHERGDRVDDDHVDAVRPDEHLDDFESLLAVVRLRDEEIVEIDAELLRVRRVERVLCVDERRDAADFLRLRDDLQRERRLARRLGPEDFDDAAPRHPSDAKRVVDADRPGRNRLDHLNRAFLTQAHDRAFAELLLDLADRQFHGLAAFVSLVSLLLVSRWGHASLLLPFDIAQGTPSPVEG